jgi:hypothetical protein
MSVPESTTRELEAIDAALAGRRVDPELTQLGELALLLRDERPRPDAAFARALDERAARGFPRASRRHGFARLAASVRSSPPRLALAAGSLASLLLVVVVSVAFLRSGDEPALDTSARQESGGGADSAMSQPAERSAIAPAPAPSTGSPRSDARRERMVERSVSLTLAARPGEIDRVADGVVRVTDAVGGFVRSSSVTSRQGASFVLRIPAAELARAVADLSRLGHVRERTQDSHDITAGFVSARERLTDARTERRSLLRQLDRADTPAETAALRARLRAVSRQIARAKAALARVTNRARYATVAVALVADRSAGGPGESGDWTPGDALRDAVRILEVAAAVALVAAAVLLPLALVAVLGWLAARQVTRRRRERALDAI